METIETIHGPMSEAILARASGTEETDAATVEWTEWRFNGEVVKRDVTVTVKLGWQAAGIAGKVE